jgi:sugar phosphate isomerase/epimerase
LKNQLALSVHPWWINGELNRLEQELGAIEEAGADFAELVLHGLDAVVGGKVVPARLRQVQAILRRHALRYTLHLPYDLNLLDPLASDLWKDVFRAGIRFAQETSCEVIVYHAGSAAGDAEELERREAETLNRLLDEAEGLSVCMENGLLYGDDVFSVGKRAEDMVRFCRGIGRPNFRLTFDAGHDFLQNRGDAKDLLADASLLLPWIGHMHLHDNFGIPIRMEQSDYSHRIACGAADLHLPPGWGGIPFPELLSLFSSYPGIFVFEIEKRFEDQYKATLDFIRQFENRNKNSKKHE